MFYHSGAETQDGEHGRPTNWPPRGGVGLNGGQNGQHRRAVRLDPAASTGNEESGTLTLTGIPRQRWRGGGPGCSDDHVRPQDATSQDIAGRRTHPYSSSGSSLCPAGICARSCSLEEGRGASPGLATSSTTCSARAGGQLMESAGGTCHTVAGGAQGSATASVQEACLLAVEEVDQLSVSPGSLLRLLRCRCLAPWTSSRAAAGYAGRPLDPHCHWRCWICGRPPEWSHPCPSPGPRSTNGLGGGNSRFG